MTKILTIVGARPQFVKAAVVSRAIAGHSGCREVIVHTGQHFDANMSDVFFDEMEIPKPDHQLSISNLSHGAMTGRMLEKLEDVMLQESPDFVLVYGDTNSTLAGALAARKLHMRVAHVEAGLRSHAIKMPEEVNRVLTDRISDILYCPTETAVQNLAREGFSNFPADIIRVGDVMEDAARYYAKKASAHKSEIDPLIEKGRDFILCTIHRAENTDSPQRLASIVAALNALSERHRVILPLHPRTLAFIDKYELELNVEVIQPVGYFDMLKLLMSCSLVITDSGGLQKEAYFFRSPCITMRDETEWTELVEHGYNELAGADTDRIIAAVQKNMGRKLINPVELYGGGNASSRIVTDLLARG